MRGVMPGGRPWGNQEEQRRAVLRYLLVFVPIAFVAEFFFHTNSTLIFTSSAIALIPLNTVSVTIAALIWVDGESNWLEGATLLAVYVILGFGCYFL